MLVVSYGSVYNYIRKYLMQILGWMDRDVWDYRLEVMIDLS